jgi:hypothetical protein
VPAFVDPSHKTTIDYPHVHEKWSITDKLKIHHGLTRSLIVPPISLICIKPLSYRITSHGKFCSNQYTVSEKK